MFANIKLLPRIFSSRLFSWRLIFVIAVFSFFLWACLYSLEKEVFDHDALCHAYWALDIIETVNMTFSDIVYTRMHDFERFPGEFYCFQESGLPVMTCFFTGAPIIYVMVPFVFFLGITPLSIVLPFALVSLLSCFFIWRVCERVIGRKSALAVLFFMCTESFFIFISREGACSESGLQVMFLWAGLWILLCFRRLRYIVRLALCAFVFGFAVYSKLMFAAYILGGIAVCFAVKSRYRRNMLAHVFPDALHFCVFVLAFIIGCLPFIWYNIDTGGTTITQTFSCLAGHTFSHSDPRMLSLKWNLADRFFQLCWILGGSYYSPDTINAIPFFVRAGLILFGLGYSIATAGKDTLSYYLLLLYVFYIVVFLSSLFSPHTFSYNHLGVLFPFLCLIRGRFFIMAMKDRGTYTSIVLLAVLIVDTWYNLDSIIMRSYL